MADRDLHADAGWIALLMLLTAMGCDGAPTLDRPEVTVSDSAGLQLVEIPPLKEFSLPELSARRLFSTRDVDGREVELFEVLDGLFLPDGSLVLANTGSQELIHLGSEGTSSRRIGRRGQGPGEFERLTKLLPAADGGFTAWDYNRFSRYSPDAEFMEVVRLGYENPVVSLVPLMVSDSGRVAAVLGEQRYFQSSGERRDTVPLLTWDADGNGPDTVGVWKGLERAFGSLERSTAFLVPIGFARTVFHASGGERVAIGSTDSLDVMVYDSDMAPLRRIVAPGRNGEVGRSEESAWEKRRSSMVPLDDEGIRKVWNEAPIHETLPGFEGLQVDPDGSLWIGEATIPGEALRRWVIFSPDGIPEAELKVPTEQFGYLPGRTELLAVGRDRIALLRRTRLDEEYVEVWEVGAQN
ncbi:MAG: hypothetical protein U5R14_06085 [Gemmatimonadota bacterium]|nr:hypothetical protein [Gemmatimonadota bacterium]